MGVAHFKMSAGYSDIFLAAMRILCMVSCLVGTGNAARVERRFGTRRSGTLGLRLVRRHCLSSYPRPSLDGRKDLLTLTPTSLILLFLADTN